MNPVWYFAYSESNQQSASHGGREVDESMKFIAFACLILTMSLGAGKAKGIRLDSDSYIKLIARGSQKATARGLVVLDKYLRLALGKKKLRSGTRRVRFILESRFEDWSDIPRGYLKDLREIDAFEIKVETGDPSAVHITGMTGHALTSGVFEFLESQIGVTWLFPGPLGISIPSQKAYLIKVGTRRVMPEFISRIYTGITDEPFPDYYDSLRLRHLIFSSHAMIRIFPIEESKRLHPEIFPMKDGKRHFPDPNSTNFAHGQHWHPCYTNSKTIEVATRKAKEFFKNKSGLTFSLGINDGTRLQCDCETCRAAGWPQSYYQFVNRVAENVKEHYPPFTVGVLAYGDVEIPANNLKLADNVLVLGGDTSGFVGMAKHLGVYEYLYGRGFWIPHFPLEGMKSNAQYHRKIGAVALHCEVHPVWAFDAPKVFLRSKLLWNADYDVHAGLERWCRAAFGAGWKPMLKFYHLWAAKRDKEVKPDAITATVDLSLFRNSNAQFSTTSENDYRQCAKWIALARKKADDPIISERLDRLEPFFDYSRNAFQMWLLKKQIFENNRKDWAALARQALALKTRREELLGTMRKHEEWFYGSEANVDHILSHRWEGRWTWTVHYENDNALRTALYNAREAGQTSPVDLPDTLRSYTSSARHQNVELSKFDAWQNYYHHHINNQMVIKSRKGMAEFRLNADAPRKIPAETPHAWLAPNGLKRHWFRGRVALDQKKHYLFDISVSGAKGRVDIRVHNANDCGMKAWLVEEFGNRKQTRNKRLLLQPVLFWGEQRNVKGWEVEVRFTPDDEDAKFEGTCSVTEVEFDKPK